MSEMYIRRGDGHFRGGFMEPEEKRYRYSVSSGGYIPYPGPDIAHSVAADSRSRRIWGEDADRTYLMAHNRNSSRIWGEHIEYCVEFGPQPPHPQPSTTDKNGDELKRGDLVWFHNQHAKPGRYRSSYTGYVLSTYKGHVQITGRGGSWVIPTCDVWLYHTPKREAVPENKPEVEEKKETSAPVKAEQPKAPAKRRKPVHRLPPAPEGCRWENYCSWRNDEWQVRYILSLKSEGKMLGEMLGDVDKDWRDDRGWNWVSNLKGRRGNAGTLYRAAKELVTTVALLMEQERRETL